MQRKKRNAQLKFFIKNKIRHESGILKENKFRTLIIVVNVKIFKPFFVWRSHNKYRICLLKTNLGCKKKNNTTTPSTPGKTEKQSQKKAHRGFGTPFYFIWQPTRFIFEILYKNTSRTWVWSLVIRLVKLSWIIVWLSIQNIHCPSVNWCNKYFLIDRWLMKQKKSAI